ncbi:MAG: hypothetical protein AB2L11_10650 [Syntrophobacteraceae bacterium]
MSNLSYPDAEGRHTPPNDNPKWNESYFFDFYDPKTTFGGIVRLGILENVQASNIWFYLFKNGKLHYNRFCAASPYTSKRMSDGIEVAGLRLTAIEPLKKALVEFDELSMSFIFDGTAPMADSIAMTIGEKAAGAAKQRHSTHLEGPARFSGSVTIRGEKTEIFDGYAFRDIHWGVRDWEGMYLYRLSWPIFSNGQSAALIHFINNRGRRAYMKMVYDGKEWLQVKDLEDNIEFAADGMTVKSVHYRFWDRNDKLWEYTAKPIHNYMIPVDGFQTSMNFMEYRLSDGTVGYGTLECGFVLPWNEKYFTPGPKRKD